MYSVQKKKTARMQTSKPISSRKRCYYDTTSEDEQVQSSNQPKVQRRSTSPIFIVMSSDSENEEEYFPDPTSPSYSPSMDRRRLQDLTRWSDERV